MYNYEYAKYRASFQHQKQYINDLFKWRTKFLKTVEKMNASFDFFWNMLDINGEDLVGCI